MLNTVISIVMTIICIAGVGAYIGHCLYSQDKICGLDTLNQRDSVYTMRGVHDDTLGYEFYMCKTRGHVWEEHRTISAAWEEKEVIDLSDKTIIVTQKYDKLERWCLRCGILETSTVPPDTVVVWEKNKWVDTTGFIYW